MNLFAITLCLCSAYGMMLFRVVSRRGLMHPLGIRSIRTIPRYHEHYTTIRSRIVIPSVPPPSAADKIQERDESSEEPKREAAAAFLKMHQDMTNEQLFNSLAQDVHVLTQQIMSLPVLRENEAAREGFWWTVSVIDRAQIPYHLTDMESLTGHMKSLLGFFEGDAEQEGQFRWLLQRTAEYLTKTYSRRMAAKLRGTRYRVMPSCYYRQRGGGHANE